MLNVWLLIKVPCFFCGARGVSCRVIISPSPPSGVHLSQWALGPCPPVSHWGCCSSTSGVYL